VSQDRNPDLQPTVLHLLQPDEELHVQARAVDGVLAVTNKRLVVTNNERVALDVPYSELRRIQFDIERDRPATLVIVPDNPSHPPEVLAIPVREYESAAQVIAVIGRRIYDQD
jgi:hypothetical protein